MATDPVPTRLYTEYLFWDKKATHTDDVDSFLPLHRLAECAEESRIGSVSPAFTACRLITVKPDYKSGRPQILKWCQEDDVDVVLLPAL